MRLGCWQYQCQRLSIQIGSLKLQVTKAGDEENNELYDTAKNWDRFQQLCHKESTDHLTFLLCLRLLHHQEDLYESTEAPLPLASLLTVQHDDVKVKVNKTVTRPQVWQGRRRQLRGIQFPFLRVNAVGKQAENLRQALYGQCQYENTRIDGY